MPVPPFNRSWSDSLPWPSGSAPGTWPGSWGPSSGSVGTCCMSRFLWCLLICDTHAVRCLRLRLPIVSHCRVHLVLAPRRGLKAQGMNGISWDESAVRLIRSAMHREASPLPPRPCLPRLLQEGQGKPRTNTEYKGGHLKSLTDMIDHLRRCLLDRPREFPRPVLIPSMRIVIKVGSA